MTQEQARDAITPEMIRLCVAAVEGECDGLAIDDKQARSILQYVLDGTAAPSAPPVTPSLEAAARQIFGVLWTAGFADFVCYEHNAAMWLEAARCAIPSAPPVMAGAVMEEMDLKAKVFDLLGEPDHKVQRLVHGADPFCYWCRESIDAALNAALSVAPGRADGNPWKPIAEQLAYMDRPIYQFVRVEGEQTHHGETWGRCWFGTACISNEADNHGGYRRADIERICRDGGMDIWSAEVTHFRGANFDFPAPPALTGETQ